MDSFKGVSLFRHSHQKVQVFHARRRTRTITHPVIRLSGLYLERYGFNVNDEVEITCVQGKIEIRKVIVDSAVT